MVMATAAFSIVLVVAQFAHASMAIRRRSSSLLAFAVNAALLLLEWALADAAPRWTARAVYLQVSGLGPMLGSGSG